MWKALRYKSLGSTAHFIIEIYIPPPLFIQGFGRWDGVYLNQLYEGYLLRVGVTVEWYHSTDIISWTNTSNDVIVTVATSDSRGRSLRVNFTGFQERQFAMHSAVQGNDTDNRYECLCLLESV